ncbi:FAD-dependent monooxygenase [Petropleomorpha daqingensis]|uniref:2-polyprenyl-6-methoxyphenol hydroxylase-like FAD-dependent oxidoreductase n=1 Tax=Petropleomorpha daqingensis TaxID=2026353 RepID=A0A853CNH8_9ACTN|nr:FAD-dependent monooxygenase [Petropleomorpha daqingensis]NYJ08062.1 2-polyprenyl-6-methoxyphenol hydroxylase-like FAD-dependent oxidoreductase [Petropleomorpha daqingensis]
MPDTDLDQLRREPGRGKQLKILVVGAGLGGLSAAIALTQIGAQVDVIEIKPDNSVPGVGFGLRLNGMRAVRELGLLEQCLAFGTKPSGLTYYDNRGRHLSDLSYGPDDGDVPSILVMSRIGYLDVATARAQELGCDIRMGTTVASLEQKPENVAVTFSSGDSAEYDLVVGFDGINSQIRHEYFGARYDPTPAGGVAWRCPLPLADGLTDTTFLQGHGGKIVFSPLSSDMMYMVLTVAEEGRPRYDPAEMPRIMYDRARALMGDSEFMAESIVQVLQSTSVAYTPYSTVWVPYPWFRGRVMIGGDAAHTMPPYLGSGAAMAIEDGVVLAQELAKDHSLLDAQLMFMARRLPRARAVHERSIESMLEEFDSVTPEAFQRRLQFLRDLEPIANEYSNRLLALPY